MNHDPPPPATFGPAAMAHLALATTARVASDYSRSLVPTQPGRHGYGGLITAAAVQLGRLVDDVLAAAIVAERADGVGWDEIADALGIDPDRAREQWATTVARWDTDLARATGPAHDDDQLPDVLTGPPTVRARELDRWATRHREPADLLEGPHPVTDTLSGG
ncbi:MAG: ARC6/PARC6 family protein [Pseudonocardia sp.]|nr:ARC6/PARC6 family protein [Pseudonocardia sp.]